MAAPKEIVELVNRFNTHKETYTDQGYNETPLRREFVDPFFEALGWDVSNKQGYAEAYKDVVHEDAVKVGTATKAPDYSFRVGGARKFFVEAKKPSVDIKADIAPAFQLRRYAWSAKLPLSILTDFEELAVYDCRQKPNKNDAASVGRVLYIKYTEFIDRWDEIAAIFSQEAVLKGSFDRFAETSKAKKGTAEVDDVFLSEIESWRGILARSIALRNENISTEELNFSVQRTIDRLIFLRICEDRGIEDYGRLLGIVNGENVYKRLCELFRQADDRYNSGLFHFEEEKGRGETPDTITLKLDIDDKALKQIIQNLYYPDSPYEFSVLPADILGQVYEQFLGKIIRLTDGHHAKVEDKPEVKKAGGVFYTPTYIVDYIVKNTVGKLIEGKTPKKIESLKILDPACGSGSFLIGAYQCLLDWHRDWYTAHDPEKWLTGKRPAIYKPRAGEYRLTTPERKRILLNNIYGVDIDTQAVEVTKLSLLLKVLEGENEQSINNQLKLFHERALPDLGNNIKCGNSLVGTDFYNNKQLSFEASDNEDRRRVNAFDWDGKDGFPEIINSGGFDAVIGNPPYIRIQAMKEWAPRQVDYFTTKYSAASVGNYDIYVVFVEKGLSVLNNKGIVGFILPHKIFNAKYGKPIRELILKGNNLREIVHFGDKQVFENATTYTCLLFLTKDKNDKCQFTKVDTLENWRNGFSSLTSEILVSDINSSEWNFASGKGAALFHRLSEMQTKLGNIADMFVGLQTSADTVFLFKDCEIATSSITTVNSKELGKSVKIETMLLKPVVRSGEIGRYWAKPTAAVLFPYEIVAGEFKLISENRMKNDYPHAWEYLLSNRILLSEREHGKFRNTGWYQLYPKNLNLWEQKKIMTPYMTTRLTAFLDEVNLYFVNVTTGGFGLTMKQKSYTPEFITGLLNSTLLNWYFKQVSTTFHGGYFAANKQYLTQLPIVKETPENLNAGNLVILVQQMHNLYKQHNLAKTEQEKATLSRQIDSTDRRIDQLVYELYGLTKEEIEIVEGGSKK